MALTPATLEVVPEHIAAGGVWIAPGVDGEIAGVVALAPRRCAGYAELEQAVRRAARYPQRHRPGPGPEEVFLRHRGEGCLDPRVADATGCHNLLRKGAPDDFSSGS
jgi:hypothetical protein